MPRLIKSVRLVVHREETEEEAGLYLDVDLVAQHSSSEDHGLGSSLELFAHVEGLLKRGAPLVHVPRIQDLSGTCQSSSL